MSGKLHLICMKTEVFMLKLDVQVNLVISKSKGMEEILRDIRSST